MEFRTKVELPADAPRLGPASQCLWMGSCFAEHVGGRWPRLCTAEGRPRTDVNPFGVLYNPESIRLGLETLLDGAVDERCLFRGRDGLWHSWLHSGDFSDEEREGCLRRIEERLRPAAALLRQADVLFLTFGTDRVYELRDGGWVAGNCHREPAECFKERSLGVDGIYQSWLPLLRRLHRVNPRLQVVYTVSPYRYAKYGLHASQLSKATLLLAVDRLTSESGGGDLPPSRYFPAYEILLDELRDYRFFAADMLHPSDVAIDYVWERFADWAFTPQMRRCAEEWRKVSAALQHRPLRPASEAAQVFRQKAEQQWQDFRRRWEPLSSSDE